VRQIWTSTELNGYLDFPHAAQVFAIQRDTTEMVSQKFRSETVYGITSMTAERANPVRILALSRTHWSIENRLQVMASLRNLAISLLRMAGAPIIASALRHCARSDSLIFRLIGLRGL
jgi:hypothetical protein